MDQGHFEEIKSFPGHGALGVPEFGSYCLMVGVKLYCCFPRRFYADRFVFCIYIDYNRAYNQAGL